MQQQDNIAINNERRSLKDFVPLVLAFFACLILLSVYQNLRLYIDGVLDGFLNKSLLLLILHNLGFAALIGLLLAFVFNIGEGRKPALGEKIVKIVLFVLLLIEGLLIEYYVRQYEILENSVLKLAIGPEDFMAVLSVVSIGFVVYFAFYYLHRRMAKVYQMVSRMYPFTIILFSLFLATLNSDKKPINENKTQHLLVSMVENALDFNTYEGVAEFPLVQNYKRKDVLGDHFTLQQEKPNIVVLVIEGLGSDFVGTKATYPGFTPYLDELAKKSLSWDNFLSNSGVGFSALTSVVGGLPFGETGFTNTETFVHRQTLFSMLKKNGYQTGFFYGGNSALNHLDKFVEEEQVDIVLDKKGFGGDYTLQEEDAAGITLGYPDKDLFQKWAAGKIASDTPTFELFYTLSTKNPYAVPGGQALENRVVETLRASKLNDRQKRLVTKNSEVFASLLYMDEAISDFMTSYQKRPEYGNTIFVITGSHNLTDLPHYNELGRYRVPLLVFSPMLNRGEHIKTLSSHADIAPSLMYMLDSAYEMEVPEQVAWLGDVLVSNTIFDERKAIPLFKDTERITDYIKGKHFISNGDVYEMDKNLKLSDVDDDVETDVLKKGFQEFRAINSYVVAHDKLIPKQNSLVAMNAPEFSKTDLIWIESAFNGKDFDNAYQTAKNLAFDEEWDRALLMCNYILTKIPGHADTEILMGRIYAWKTDYEKAEALLKKAIRKYPVYDDAYAALFDVYYWNDTPKKAEHLTVLVHKNNLQSVVLDQKIARAVAHKNNIKEDRVVEQIQ
ncbi:LTA synthase family protein [Aggregatimonas sangjinii]|uniref:LTA synthase family protein n=1 Tax=Aggregatimonas sangjinii TaxID=2583587 RepID=A0A5B7STN9_9FLAO|nr:sulfatase-like hydrolase/transferase [Aggregatimonas sangjinii]QCX00074.1 LTA synthase family protein [Aggregatimonas sangjinii]